MRLEIITGPMFAGKTSLLLERRPDVILRPPADTRYADEAMTHDKQPTPAGITVHRRLALVPTMTIAIDEMHMWPREDREAIYAFTREHVDGRGPWLIVAGLRYRADRTTFDWVEKLFGDADRVLAMWLRCRHCGSASMFQRCISGRIENAGPADYVIECPVCWGGNDTVAFGNTDQRGTAGCDPGGAGRAGCERSAAGARVLEQVRELGSCGEN